MNISQSQMQILLCGNDEDDRMFFTEAMQELKVQNVLQVFEETFC